MRTHIAGIDRGIVGSIGAPILLGLAVACADLTRVSAPDIVQPSAFDNPSGALVRRAGAIADFYTAYSDQVFFSGLITDEFTDIGTAYTDDRRIITDNSENYPYPPLSGARIDALRAIETLEHYNPTPAWHIGELFAYLGYVETFFAENMCSGTPEGMVVNEVPQVGPTLSRHDLIALALAHFDSASSYAVGMDSILDLASIGRSRALLDSGDFGAASAAATNVPTNYLFEAQYDASVNQLNTVYTRIAVNLNAGVADREGINGLDFITAGDPRVRTSNVGNAQNGAPVYEVQADSNASAPILIATGIEARLIGAEAALKAGNISAWATTLNALRMAFPDTSLSNHPLPADSSTSASPSTQVNVMFRERAFWLFGTGHRQGDMRRLIRQYGRQTESVFPTGAYEGGTLTYGTAVVFVPQGEQYNPNYHGCLNESP